MQLPALIASLIFAAVFAIDSLAEDLDDRSDSVSQKPIRIRVNRNALNDYYEFSQMAPENYFTLFNNRHSNREVAEVWLLKLALQKGGWNNPIKLFPGDDRYDASVALLNKGRVLMNSDSTWLGSISNLADKVYISPPLLRRGELEAGLYTAANSPLLQSAEVNVTALSSIASRFWEVDWAVLQSLNLRQLQHHDSYYYMLKAVDRGRIDFMLQLFQTGPDMALRWKGLTLLPIPEVKVALNDSRHFVVSRGYPQSDEFFTALKNGVVKLRKEDAIVAIYRQAGVIGNPKTKNWRLLNPVAVP